MHGTIKCVKIAKLVIISCFIIDAIVIVFILLHGKDIELLNPAGIISASERNLLYIASFIGFIALLPVFILYTFVSTKYKNKNTKNQYDPDSKHSKWLEILWWIFPAILVFIFASVTWSATHALDPYKSIPSSKKPLIIQVVALRWRWLFIYPKQDLATINSLVIPVNTPVTFTLTADAPMNSFWIPQLSGQMYAMAGMSTQLHIMASKEGVYRGSAAEINGKGFSEMDFSVRVVSDTEFKKWISQGKEDNNPLTSEKYTQIAKPNTDDSLKTYSTVSPDLYNTIIMNYMIPSGQEMHMHHGEM